MLLQPHKLLESVTTQRERFTAYLGKLAAAAGHADRSAPLKAYCTGVLLPGARKSIEPMAARLAPGNVSRMHQSLHHLVADSPWSDEAVLRQVRSLVLPEMERQSPVQVWVVKEAVFLKRGVHSVGTVRQESGEWRKKENCRIAVALFLSTWNSSLPIGWRLYLPETWVNDAERKSQAGIPADVQFQTKSKIALQQIRQAIGEGVAARTVLAEQVFGADREFRFGIDALGLHYVVAIPREMEISTSDEVTTSAQQIALSLPENQWRDVLWNEGGGRSRRSRFAAVLVNTESYSKEWLLLEWPKGTSRPTGYWLSNLPANTKLRDLARLAKYCWASDRASDELKYELGIGHFEGRTWRGFHHHVALCTAAYGFLVAERNSYCPSARVGDLELEATVPPHDFRPRGSPALVLADTVAENQRLAIPNSFNM